MTGGGFCNIVRLVPGDDVSVVLEDNGDGDNGG